MFMECSKWYNSAALSAIQPAVVSDLGVSAPQAVIPCSVDGGYRCHYAELVRAEIEITTTQYFTLKWRCCSLLTST